MSENLLEVFLQSFSSENNGCLNEEQFQQMCSEPSIGFDASTSEMLYNKLPKNDSGQIRIKDIIAELSNWQDGSVKQKQPSYVKKKPDNLTFNGNTHSENAQIYEVDNFITSPVLESSSSFNDFEVMISQRYPELLMSFEHLARDIKSEIKAKKMEKDELEISYENERKQRREDLNRLEKELEAEFRNSEKQIEEKIRRELEKKYQTVISKKEIEINQFKDLVNDIEKKQEILTAKEFDRQSKVEFFNGEEEKVNQMNKITSDDFKKYDLKSMNDIIAGLDPDDIDLKEFLKVTLNKLQSSQVELKSIHDQLDIQTNQLIENEVYAEENKKVREKLEKEILSIRKKLDELNESSYSPSFHENDITDHEFYSESSSYIRKNSHLHPDLARRKKSSIRNLEATSYNPLDEDALSEGSELHVSILDSSEEFNQPDRIFKVIMVGDSSVGKSSFLNRFVQGNFYQGYKSTIGVDFMAKNIRIDRKLYTIQLWDTAGQEKYRSIVKSFFRKSDGAIVMYDVTNQKSFWSVREWISLIEENDEKIPIIIVGNKTDLRDDLNKISKKNTQMMIPEHGIELAKSYDANFIEVSVLKNINVRETIVQLSRKMKHYDDLNLSRAADCVLQASDEKPIRSCCK